MNEIDFDSITFTDNFMFQSVMMEKGSAKRYWKGSCRSN